MKPANLSEAIAYFSDLELANSYVAELRWPDGFVCPHCGGRDHSYLSTRRLWKCKTCKKQSSVKVGTIFEGSPLGLDKWLPAIWLVANSEAVSAAEVAGELGVTQKSAVFMLDRIRGAEPSRKAAGEPAENTHPASLVALVLAVFAFGVFVGRLTKRTR